MMKYIDAEKLIKLVKEMRNKQMGFACDAVNEVLKIITSLQQEHEIVELSFKGGTYRVNGEENTFKGGKAKIIILEVNQEEENV